jgi:hypothetical protein
MFVWFYGIVSDLKGVEYGDSTFQRKGKRRERIDDLGSMIDDLGALSRF